ncbi:Dolichol phosphate-mannose biosynthesis regulatory protein [Leucoagaricus sp. SymC.cos]|nr:Dolichol phosphate-mannose biosynthesis regulatory protein [Leucoagaricus sp. SymC.cos]
MLNYAQGTSDKALGGAMLLAASVVFTYYTTWAILLPFFDPSSQIHNFFPSREWAVRLPAIILVVGLTVIGLFVGQTIAKENRKKAEKARLRMS